MLRLALAALLLLASAALAAPVPKALKNKSPQVAGGTWVGSGGTNVVFEYTFAEGGTFSATHNGQAYSKGTWTQDGDQFVAVMSGWGGAVPLWGGEVAKAVQHINQGGALWVFKLPKA